MRCFDAAARHESFTRAGEELHLTHGAVSRAVRGIEDQLGIALFERRNRRVVLTPAGRKLADAVHASFASIAIAVRDLRRGGGRPALVLSCEPTLLMRWLIPAIPQLQATHPEIVLQLLAAGGPVPFERDGIDIAIRRNDFSWPKSVVATQFMGEFVGPVLTPQLAAGLDIAARGTGALRQATLLDTRTRLDAWPQWLQSHAPGMASASAQTFDHFYFTLQAAASGLGVAMAPYVMVQPELESGVLVAPFGFDRDGSHYCLLAPASTHDDPHAQTLLAWLTAKAQTDLSRLACPATGTGKP